VRMGAESGRRGDCGEDKLRACLGWFGWVGLGSDSALGRTAEVGWPVQHLLKFLQLFKYSLRFKF
jgi:hypothetical protein